MKPFLVSLAIAIVFASISPTTALAQLPCDPAPSGIVSWWAGEGNAFDQINGYDGTLVGGVNYGSGEVGQSFMFDGNGGSGVQIGSSTGLQLQDFTIETWIKRASTSTVSYGSGGSGTIFGYGPGGYFFFMNGTGNLTFSQLGNSAYLIGQTITDTNFHHVVVTKSGSTIVFYLDGVAYGPQTYSVTFTFTGGPGIGCRPDTGDNSFYGRIDELSVYNRALSPSEIQDIYNAGNAGKCPVPPFITSQPTNQMVFVGQPASLNVMAAGTQPLSYQWRFNTTNIVGATNAVLTLSSAQFTNAGIYSVVVSNAINAIQSSNATLTVYALPPCDPAPSGIVSWWAGEGNAFDQINGYDGTLVGGVNYGSGEVGQSFMFDGNGGSGVQIGSSTGLQLQDFTIETWIKRASTSTVSYGSGGSGTIFGYGPGGYFFFMNGTGNLTFSQLGNSAYLIGQTITDTNFHHVVVTKSGSTIVFYLDGVAYGPQTYSVTFTFTGGPGIGCRPDTGDNSFYGRIDELSVYNRALSPSEIQDIYNAGNAGKCPVPCVPHTATGIAILTNGSIVGINLTGEGCGYTNTPVIHVFGGNGNGAQAIAMVSNGVVVAIDMIDTGSGYTSAPSVVIDPPFISNPVLGIAAISVLTFSNVTIGTNYQLQQFQPPIWINKGGSFTASNLVYMQTVANWAGSGDYRLAQAPVPIQATAIPQVVNGFVVHTTVINGGSGYVTTPAVAIVADVGSNATAVASIGGGRVTAITITSAGIDYVNPVTIQIDPPPAIALSPAAMAMGVRLDSSNLAPFYNYQYQFWPDLGTSWSNLTVTLFNAPAATNSLYYFPTNRSGFFRLQYIP